MYTKDPTLNEGKQGRKMGQQREMPRLVLGIFELVILVIFRPIWSLKLIGSWFPERSANLNSVLSRRNQTVAITISALFAQRQSRVNLMTFQTIDNNLSTLIGHFRVLSGLCIKTRLSAQPLIWKWFFILMKKLIFTRKVVHLAS